LESELKAVPNSGVVDLPEQPLKALRETKTVVDVALAVLGRAHLDEGHARRRYEGAVKLLKAAEEGAGQALVMENQVQKRILESLEVGDGAWELDLEAGKLVMNDGQS